jgi:TonB family protein
MPPSVINPLPSMGYDLPTPSSAAAGRAANVARRGSSSLVQVIIALSWIVGITGSFLTVGIMGMFAADLPPIHLRTLEDDVETPMEEILSGEQMAYEETAEQPSTGEPVSSVVVPEAVETPPESPDLPDIVEAMTLEDVFAIPTAPKIEAALRPIDPVAKPKPAPQRTNQSMASGNRGTSSSQTQGGPAGGRGGIGSGTGGKWINPKPPYPDFAASAGMHGIVRLKISVGPTGAIESVSVIGTSGYSALDESASSWVRKRWRAPATGVARSYNQPFNFKKP